MSSKYSCRNYSHVNIHVPSRPLAKGLTKRKRKNAVSDFQLRSRLEDILANFSEQLAARKWNSELCFYVSSEERDSLGLYMSVHYLPATAGDEKKKARKKSPKASCNFRGTGWLKGQNSWKYSCILTYQRVGATSEWNFLQHSLWWWDPSSWTLNAASSIYRQRVSSTQHRTNWRESTQDYPRAFLTFLFCFPTENRIPVAGDTNEKKHEIPIWEHPMSGHLLETKIPNASLSWVLFPTSFFQVCIPAGNNAYVSIKNQHASYQKFSLWSSFKTWSILSKGLRMRRRIKLGNGILRDKYHVQTQKRHVSDPLEQLLRYSHLPRGFTTGYRYPIIVPSGGTEKG